MSSHQSIIATDSSSAVLCEQVNSSEAVCGIISGANTVLPMSKQRRELSAEEKAECARLKAVFESRKAEARAAGRKLTQADVGDACGWQSGQSAVNQYMNSKVPLNIDALLKLAAVLGFEPAEVSPRLAGDIARIAQAVESNVEPGPEITSPYRAVKIVGTAQMGAEGYWYALDEGDGVVDVPSSDPDAYALRLRGDSMAPAIRSGWVAVVEPSHRLVPGEYVMIRLQDGESMLKELLFANEAEISVMSINDAYGRRTIPTEQIEHIHYVGTIVAPSKIRV